MIDDDGFNILQKLVFTDSPQLGGEERDLYEFVNTLTIIIDEYLYSLYHRAKTMEQEITLQQDQSGHHNRLIKNIIDLIACIPQFQGHLTSVIKSIIKFFRTPNHHLHSLPYDVDKIYEDLVDTKANLQLVFSSSNP